MCGVCVRERVCVFWYGVCYAVIDLYFWLCWLLLSVNIVCCILQAFGKFYL